MGKGTGTGAAPVIANIARELGILTVGLVTSPFSAEGPRRFQQASDGISELKKYVDTLLVISNDKLREIHGNLTLSAAFGQADNILSNAAKSIAEIITVPGYVNVDFEDVNTVMRNSGVAIMGIASCDGEDRAMKAVGAALTSPLLNDNDIKGAKNILVNINSGKQEVTLDEVSEITEYIQREAGYETNIIWGNCFNESLGDHLSVTVIATGFEATITHRQDLSRKHLIRHSLDNKEKNDVQLKEPLKIDEPELKPSEPVIQEPVAKKVKPKIEKETEKSGLQIPFEFDLTSTLSPSDIQHTNKKENEASVRFNLEQEKKLPETSKKEDEFILKEKNEAAKEEKITAMETAQLSNAAAKDRVSKLRGLSMKLNNAAVLNEMEKEPAFMRRGVNMKNVPASNDTNRSAYYVEKPEDENEIAELKKSNSFLHDHDRVD
jgi:cell division protein FtsZ